MPHRQEKLMEFYAQTPGNGLNRPHARLAFCQFDVFDRGHGNPGDFSKLFLAELFSGPVASDIVGKSVEIHRRLLFFL
jgi:hypothetical protein